MSPRLGGPGGDRATLGALAVIAASLPYAVAAIFSRRVLSGVAPVVIGGMQMTWSMVLIPGGAAMVNRRPRRAPSPADTLTTPAPTGSAHT